MVKEGRPWHQYKQRIIDALEIFAFAQMFHWTPDQVRSLDDDDKMAMMSLMKGFGEAKPPER